MTNVLVLLQYDFVVTSNFIRLGTSTFVITIIQVIGIWIV